MRAFWGLDFLNIGGPKDLDMEESPNFWGGVRSGKGGPKLAGLFRKSKGQQQQLRPSSLGAIDVTSKAPFSNRGSKRGSKNSRKTPGALRG